MKNLLQSIRTLLCLGILTIGFINPIFAQTGNVGIGVQDPDASAILHVQSTTKGLMVPRTDSNINNWTPIPTGNPDGLLRYDTNTKKLQSWNAGTTSWTTVGLWQLLNGAAVYDGNVAIPGNHAFAIGSNNDNDYNTSPDAQLVLDGFGNSSFNNGTKLLIRGHNNDAPGSYPIKVQDENGNIDFQLHSIGDFTTSFAYFGNRVGIGLPTTAVPTIDLAVGDNDTGLNQEGDGNLAIYTNNVERLRINSFGNVGIDATSPNSPLSISPSATEAKITLYDGGSTTDHYGFGVSSGQLNYHTNSAHVFYNGGKNGNGTELMKIKSNSDVQIGGTSTAALIHYGHGPDFGSIASNFNPTPGADGDGAMFEYVASSSTESAGFYGDGDMSVIWSSGDLYLLALLNEDDNMYKAWFDENGTLSQGSDIRFKKDIEPVEGALDKLLSMRGVTYGWKITEEEKNKKEHIIRRSMGVIAQEVEAVFPDLVSTNTQGYKGVNYDGFVSIFIEAFKEQDQIIKTQAQTIQNQQKELDEMKARLDRIEALLKK